MDEDCNIFHQLPVVNFNRCSNNIFRASGDIKAEFYHEDTYTDAKEKQTRKINSLVGTSPKCAKIKSASPLFIKKRLRSSITITNSLSKRSLFGKSPSKFPINTIQISSSLNKIKQKKSLYGVFSEHVKEKIYNLFKIKIKTDDKDEKPALKENDEVNNIQVLFDAKKSKSASKPARRRRKRNFSGDYRRLDMLYNSKSSYDINGFRYRQRKPNFCYQLLKCKSNSFLKRHKYHNNYNEHHFFRKPETQRRNISAYKCLPKCNCCNPVHYKLVNFPSNNNNKCLDFKTSSSRNCNCKKPIVIHQTRMNRGVIVTPSCFKCINGAGDSAEYRQNLKLKRLSTNCNIKKQRGNSDNMISKCKTRKQCKSKRLQRCKPKLSLLATIYFSQNYFFSLIKIILKFILFSLAIIAGSPCIISVFVYWLITYPLRPQHIFKQAKNDAHCNYGSCFNGNEFWHFIFHSIVRAFEKVGHAYSALCSSIKNQKLENTNTLKSCAPRSFAMNRNSINKHRRLHMCASPKKRYTLYYARHRGWIMKPTREHSNGKQNLHKYCPKERNINKLQGLKKNKRYPGIFHIGVHGTSTSLTNMPYIKLSKKRPICGKRKRDLKTYTSKMVSTASSPLLLNIFSSMDKIPLHNFQRKNKTCEPKYTEIPFFVEMSNERINTCEENKQKYRGRAGNILYNTQISTDFNKHLTKKKFVEPFCHRYQNMEGKRKNRWIPCSCSHRRFLLQNVHYPRSSKITFVKPSRQKTRTKYHITSMKKHKNLTLRQKVFNYFKSAFKRFRCVVRNADSEVWTSDLCNDMYVSTLRKKPWFWVYKRCPSFYPYFLVFCKFNKNICHCLLLMISACIWCPVICCCYFCYELFCKCICE